MPETLWCVHLEGGNEYHAEVSHDAAVESANNFNEYDRRTAQRVGSTSTYLNATVVEWPFTAAMHARSITEAAPVVCKFGEIPGQTRLVTTRNQWVALDACGCAIGVMEAEESTTALPPATTDECDAALAEFYEVGTELIAAVRRGVKMIRVPHDRYEALYAAQVSGTYACPHTTAPRLS